MVFGDGGEGKIRKIIKALSLRKGANCRNYAFMIASIVTGSLEVSLCSQKIITESECSREAKTHFFNIASLTAQMVTTTDKHKTINTPK